VTPPTAVVIVPTFNERDSLPILAAALMQHTERQPARRPIENGSPEDILTPFRAMV
jgi:hypothetical protein